MTSIDETHDPAARSWVESANDPECDFPIQNLPFGVFSTPSDPEARHVAVAIGDQLLDLDPWLGGPKDSRFDTLNGVMSGSRSGARELRRLVFDLLRADSKSYRAQAGVARRSLVPMSEATMHLPAQIGDYTDFYASIHHATNVGGMFRPDNPLLPNYKWVPIGYHGRASSIVVSGTPIVRPSGQTRDDPNAPPKFGPSKRLDYELEVGLFVTGEGEIGEPHDMSEAEQRMFGICLVNDWSARDIQTWEYQPLGPFLAKNFATTISPWVVTLDALEPFRIPRAARADGDPQPLPYLDDPNDRERGGIDITLEVSLASARMREHGMIPHRVSLGSFRQMYWTFAQMLTHHASNGCNLRAGDLIASGTVSGPEKESRGCLLERTWRGTEPLQLPTGETRTFLEDGDEVIMRGWCEREGFRRIGLGECRGVVVASHDR